MTLKWMKDNNGALTKSWRVAGIVVAVITSVSVLFAAYRGYLYSTEGHAKIPQLEKVDQDLANAISQTSTVLKIFMVERTFRDSLIHEDIKEIKKILRQRSKQTN